MTKLCLQCDMDIYLPFPYSHVLGLDTIHHRPEDGAEVKAFPLDVSCFWAAVCPVCCLLGSRGHWGAVVYPVPVHLFSIADRALSFPKGRVLIYIFLPLTFTTILRITISSAGQTVILVSLCLPRSVSAHYILHVKVMSPIDRLAIKFCDITS